MPWIASRQVQGLESRLRRCNPRFTIAQYNILAGYLGNNTEPWFMYGVDMPAARRKSICQKHTERGPDGKYLNVGWPNYVTGILSDDEIAAVEQVDEDKGGSISPQELGSLMETLGLKPNQEELDAMIREIDEDGNGEIEFDEFVQVRSRPPPCRRPPAA